MRNWILHERASQHTVENYRGALSLKTVRQGEVTWHTRGGRHAVRPGQWLVLNAGTEYSLDIRAPRPVETWCMFFAPGFVEDVSRVLSSAPESLLDDPHRPAPAWEFFERVNTGPAPAGSFEQVAEALTQHRLRQRREWQSIPALRPSTRDELYRRLLRARDFLAAAVDSPVRLGDVAREAALSPFHLHRLFAEAFGQTPHEYLTGRRLERAQRLLRSTELEVGAVAGLCGFESHASFTRLFRRRFGVTPQSARSA